MRVDNARMRRDTWCLVVDGRLHRFEESNFWRNGTGWRSPWSGFHQTSVGAAASSIRPSRCEWCKWYCLYFCILDKISYISEPLQDVHDFLQLLTNWLDHV